MPTSHTYNLYNDPSVSFHDFVIECAKSTGAHYELRNDPHKPHPPEMFQPGGYYAVQLEAAKADIALVESWSDAEADEQARLVYENAMRDHERALARRSAAHERYEVMLAQVNAWTPPTSEHLGLKEFMIRELKQSIEVDCNAPYLPTPKLLSGAHYREQRLEAVRPQVAYYTEWIADGVRLSKQRTEWAEALLRNLSELADVSAQVEEKS